MTDTSIGDEPGQAQESGIGDADDGKQTGDSGESVLNDDAGHDLTREDIEAGHDDDNNTSADGLQRSGTTNKLHGDVIDLGK